MILKDGATGVFFCCDDLRRRAVDAQSNANGIDYLEVIDRDEPVPSLRQRKLRVHFVNPPAPTIGKSNIRIDGGERITGFEVTNIDTTNAASGVLVITLDRAGDFSPYVLRFVEPDGEPLATLDPRLASIEFSFKVECPTEFDCRPPTGCAVERPESPRIDYLARDYTSFRRLMLDRLSLLAPRWKERNPADLGIALVEMLAYVADQLSYEQDAAATEAYLGTARRRTSVRRHARLVDYRLHDGCNARAFVRVEVMNDLVLPEHTKLFTRIDRLGPLIGPADLDDALNSGATVFETIDRQQLYGAHRELKFYTWDSDHCCLPKGSTSATLAGAIPNLKGRLLVFQEVVGPRTNEPADADPSHRHAVRVTNARIEPDPVHPGTDVTEIEWSGEDALPFPLCISSIADQADSQPIKDVSVAYGNIVLADHGRTYEKSLGTVPKPHVFRPPGPGIDPCDRAGPVAVPARFSPRLERGPLTQQGRIARPSADDPRPAPYDPTASAAAAMQWRMDLVLPSIALKGTLGADQTGWDARSDLFSSHSADPHFVAEVEDDGIAAIRFGDDDYGRRPSRDMTFQATYRIGNGQAGNIGADAIAHIHSTGTGIRRVTNPMPARGGSDPEPLEHARQAAPSAFRVQERAVTEADYAAVTQRMPGIDHAVATFRWTGSWYTVFNTVDRTGGLPVDDLFRRELRDFVERYRVVGNDIEVDRPRFVPVDVTLAICVKPEFFRADVHAELLDIFSSGVRRDGRRGFFHPDNFTFGQSIYLSRIYAAAQATQGVDSVTVVELQRHSNPATSALLTGELPMGRLEIARVENSRDFPERGKLELQMRGGR